MKTIYKKLIAIGNALVEEIEVLEREFLFNPDRYLLILSLILLNAEYERLNDLK
jgi:hypothetical protein